MGNYQNQPQNGTVWTTADGCNCAQAGYRMVNGQMVKGGNASAPAFSSVGNVKNRPANIVLSPDAFAQMLMQQSQGASGFNNTYGLADQPGRGATSAVRTSVPGQPQGIAVNNYTVVLDNTGVGATADVRYIGDWGLSWQLKNPLPSASPGLTISGSYGTASISHATNRQVAAPWNVRSIQVIASNQDYYGADSVAYIDTKPNGSNPVYLPYDLSTLLNASQFNPTIQDIETPILFDGITAFQVKIPAGRKVTLTFEIISEGRGHQMLML